MIPTNYTYDALAEQLAKTSPTLRFQDGYDVTALNAAVETAGKIPGSEIHFVVPVVDDVNNKCYEQHVFVLRDTVVCD